MSTWPEASLDRVDQLRVLASALPAVAMEERVLDAPFEDVWGLLSDLEHGIPSFDTQVRWVRIVARDGERLQIVARAFGMSSRFDVELREGWCWMQAPRYLVGMAAEPHGDGRTRVGHLEGVPSRWARPLRPILRRIVRGDVDGMARELGLR